MKSILYVSRELKRMAKQYEYIVVYGAGVWGRYCKEFLDNCHITIECFVVSNIRENNIDVLINNIPVYDIKDFPYSAEMTSQNTLFIVAVSDKYVNEICTNLKMIIGDKLNIYIYSRKMKNSYIGITTVAGCRVNCSYCPQEVFLKKYYGSNNAQQRLSLSEYQKILSNIPTEVQINFAGFSEPFLNDECKEMILYTAKKGHYVQIFTTMVGLTKEIIEEIFGHADFILHLPGNDETNIAIDDVYIDCLKLLFEKNKIDRRIKYISVPGGGINFKLAPYISSDVTIDSYCMDRAGNVEQGIKSEYSGSLTCMRTYNRLDQNVMLPNGDLILCCQDWELRYVLGNLKDTTYIDILESKNADKIRKEMASGKEDMICCKCNYALELID